MASSLTREQVASAQREGDYAIKSESSQPKLDTSQWPLLLKNYDKLLIRSSHFTPIPSGSSPLKRDISSYIKYFILPFLRLNFITSPFLGPVSSTSTNLRTHLLMRWSLGLGGYCESKKQVTAEPSTRR